MVSDGLPEPGDICESCRAKWEAKGMPPKTFVALPRVTQRYHATVAICLYCDGEPILDFAIANYDKAE